MRDGNGDRDSDGRLANNQDNRRENLQIGATERVCGRFELVNRSIRRNTPAFACFDDACSIRLDNGRGNSQKNQRGTLGSGSTNGESVDNDDTNHGGNRRGLIFDCRTHFRIKKAADRIVRRNFFEQEWLGSFFNELRAADTIKIAVDVESRGVEVFKSDSVVGGADFERNFAF